MAEPSNDEKKTVEQMIKRAMVDREFRRLALNRPGEAYRAIAGKAMPADLKLSFVEDGTAQPGEAIVLPPYKEGQVSDEELENVAGGRLKWYGATLDPLSLTVGLALLGIAALLRTVVAYLH